MMRHALVRLTGLLIVLMLVLTGCNLITTDRMMELDEEFAAKKKQYSAVVATYDGGEITQEQVMGNFSSQYSYMSQMYAMYGVSMNSEVVATIMQSVVENEMQNVAIAKELEARGLALDEEKLAEVKSSAEETYQQAYDNFYPSSEGDTDEIRAKQTEYDLYVSGYSADSFYQMELAEANRALFEDTVEGEITEVTDEELQAAYEENVAGDEETYGADDGSFESAMMYEGTTVYWVPEGYRTVKHILIVPQNQELADAVSDARSEYRDVETRLEELRTELDELNDDDSGEDEPAEAGEESEEAGEAEPAEETEEEPAEAPRTAEEIEKDISDAEAELETLKASVADAEQALLDSESDRLSEIYEKLADGEDFNALIEAYGEDPGMKNEPTSSRGYYVSADSVSWDEAFTKGAMALQNVGDVTETPVIGTSGLHIIRYESDVTPGPVPMEEIRDALYEETLHNMKHEHFDEVLTGLTEALNPKYNLSAFVLE